MHHNKLFCLASYRDLSVLYSALQLAPIGTVFKLDNGIQIQNQGDIGNFLVLRRTHKDEHIQVAMQHLGNAVEPVILDSSYNGNIAPIVDNVDELARHVSLTQRARNKLAMDLFGDYHDHDVRQGFQLLVSMVFPAPPPPPQQAPATRKRVRAKECVVCLSRAVDVMLNCGHECVCSDCCDEWMKVKQTCPVCTEDVKYIYN